MLGVGSITPAHPVVMQGPGSGPRSRHRQSSALLTGAQTQVRRAPGGVHQDASPQEQNGALRGGRGACRTDGASRLWGAPNSPRRRVAELA